MLILLAGISRVLIVSWSLLGNKPRLTWCFFRPQSYCHVSIATFMSQILILNLHAIRKYVIHFLIIDLILDTHYTGCPRTFLTHSFSNNSLQPKETYANYMFMKTREHNNLENLIFDIQHYTRKFICTIEKMCKIGRNLQSKETIK